jgi:alpha-D-ribose 1-methylphosphonate 5-triphosphate synthase subunit PhnH
MTSARVNSARVTAAAFPAPGFADPTRDAQRAFRAVLNATANPTAVFPLVGPNEPPAALGRGLAAVALTLLDEDCSVWLGAPLADDPEVAAWLAFHTGARRPDSPASADFVITGPDSLPPLASLMLGTDEAPHRSATVVLDTRGSAVAVRLTAPRFTAPRFTARGPGIDGTATLAAPWASDGFAPQWHANNEIFPRGVDLLLVDDATVTALPRTTRLTAA